MSSRADSSFWQGTGFRWSALLALSIWFFSSVIVFTIVALVETALYTDLKSDLDEQVMELSELLEQGDYPLDVGDMVERSFTEDHDIEFEQVEPMLVRLWNRYEQSEERDELTRTQLWLLGEDDLEPNLELVNRATEALRDYLPQGVSQLMALRADWLKLSVSWETQSQNERLQQLASLIEDEWQDARCYAFYDDEQQTFLTNIENIALLSEVKGFKRYEVLQTNSRLGQTSGCLMQEYNVNRQTKMLFGVPSGPLEEMMVNVYQIRNWSLPIVLLMSLVIAGLLGVRFTRKLGNINAVARNVMAGDLTARTNVTQTHDDFDRLAKAIDQMLDHIQRLMSGVRDVSDNISHDLRTPLTRLRNRIDQLSQQSSIDPSDMQGLSRDADQLLETFSALLRISQLEQGSQRRAFESFDLVASLHDIFDMFEPVFNSQNIDLKLDIATEKQSVYGDRDLWMQVLTNLLENVLRYAGNSKMVTLHLHIEAGAAVVEVKDQGPGIPEEYLDRVLERFFRGDQSRSSSGTGLGLSLVAAVCRAMNVRLILLNDRGLTVKLYWPTR